MVAFLFAVKSMYKIPMKVGESFLELFASRAIKIDKRQIL
jgi:hypothetical protein